MMLKRQHANDDDGKPACVGVEVIHTGASARQNFSTKLVVQGLTQGWIELTPKQLTLRGSNATLNYKVLRAPGSYSLHDGKSIPISELALEQRRATGVGTLAAVEARAFLKASGAPPDAGYEVINHYECELDATQHAQFKNEG